MPTTARDAAGARASTSDRVVSLSFRDQLRIEYDHCFRELFLRISGKFEQLPSRAWNGVRRHPIRAEHPWGRFLVLIDDAVREGADEESLLEIPATVAAYIRTRCAMRSLTPTEGVMTIPDDARQAA